MLKAVYLISFGPPDEPTSPDQPITMEAVLDPDVLACNEELLVAHSPANIVRVRGRVVPPKIRQRLEPSYPGAAQRSGITGIVVMEAVISRTGCIRDMHLLKSVHPLLDSAAIWAVSHWRYDPATLDDRPVSVYLTVTVNFQM